jgi:DNA processing protein
MGDLPPRWAGSDAGPRRPEPTPTRQAAAGVEVVAGDDPRLARLVHDPRPPDVLYAQGDLVALTRPTVAVVGTRDCTAGGLDTAHALGAGLAAAGVAVISGLALGIDGAAHAGALAAAGWEPSADGLSPTPVDGGAADVGPPIGVVGTGLDVVYPRRHRALWLAVRRAGLLLSEEPPGTAPAAWRFPRRNRLIAALADVVVVVESHRRGGSLHTVDEALARDVEVMAVPGSVRSPASAGTNQLLRDGAGVACDVDDVLVRLGFRRRPAEPGPEAPPPDLDAELSGVLDAMGWEPCSLDHLALRTGAGVAEVAVALARLEAGGWVHESAGWFERRAKPR